MSFIKELRLSSILTFKSSKLWCLDANRFCKASILFSGGIVDNSSLFIVTISLSLFSHSTLKLTFHVLSLNMEWICSSISSICLQKILISLLKILSLSIIKLETNIFKYKIHCYKHFLELKHLNVRDLDVHEVNGYSDI